MVFCLVFSKAGVVDGPRGLADPQSLAKCRRHAARVERRAVGGHDSDFSLGGVLLYPAHRACRHQRREVTGRKDRRSIARAG